MYCTKGEGLQWEDLLLQNTTSINKLKPSVKRNQHFAKNVNWKPSTLWITHFTKQLKNNQTNYAAQGHSDGTWAHFPLYNKVPLLNAVMRIFFQVHVLPKSLKCTISRLLFINYKSVRIWQCYFKFKAHRPACNILHSPFTDWEQIIPQHQTSRGQVYPLLSRTKNHIWVDKQQFLCIPSMFKPTISCLPTRHYILATILNSIGYFPTLKDSCLETFTSAARLESIGCIYFTNWNWYPWDLGVQVPHLASK